MRIMLESPIVCDNSSHWARRLAPTCVRTVSLLALVACLGCSSDDDDDPITITSLGEIDPEERADDLQEAVDDVMDKYDVPGIVAGVWTSAGSWTSATGEGGDGELGVDDHFGIRSVTKSFVVTVLLQLIDEEEAELDDTVDEYVDDVPNGDEITLADLAGMTSGLYDYTRVPAFRDELISDTTEEHTTAELLEFAFEEPVEFDPGTKYSYSNTNTLVLGEVIEAITGRSLAEELEDRIFDPLDLEDTVYHESGSEVPPPASLGFLVDPDEDPEPIAVAFSAFGASGAMTSNLQDLRRWATALGRGDLLSPAIHGERLDAARPATNGPKYDDYGLGIGSLDGWWGHTGSGLGYQAAAFFEPDSGSVIVVELNTAPRQNAQAELFQALREVLEKQPD